MTTEQRRAEIQRLQMVYAAALNAPRMSDGNISSTQINRMGKRQYKQWQKNVQKGFDVRDEIRDLSRTDEQIAASEAKFVEESFAIKRESAQRYIPMIEGLGAMSHLKNGKLKKSYRVAVDAQLAIIAVNQIEPHEKKR